MSTANERIMSVNKQPQYTCSKCFQYFTTRDSLIRHVFSHFSPWLNPPLHICLKCGQIFSSKSNLFCRQFEERNETIIKHSSLIELACEFCGDVFSSWCSLTKHVFTHMTAISAPIFVCTYYSEDFDDVKKLYFHKSTTRTSQRRDYYDCRCDSAIYEGQHPTTEHKRIHSGKRPLFCEVCGKSFTQSRHLKKHKRTHLVECPFSSIICGKSFTTSGILEKNSRIHLGELQFSCEICVKSFKRARNLKIHNQIHLGERPFHCKICGKSFTESGILKKHERTHLGERPFSCEKSFTESWNLKHHKRIHLGERPFSCEICGKSFTESGNLKIQTKFIQVNVHFPVKFVEKLSFVLGI